MLAALSHDFVHRRNIRIASQREEKTAFVASTTGCHYTNMIGAIAGLHNSLCKSADPRSGCVPIPARPELCAADSGEAFGLGPSEHISTFGGLVKEEINEIEVDLTFTPESSSNPGVVMQGLSDGPGQCNSSVMELAFQSSSDFILHELNIDPKLLELPETSTTQGGCHSGTLSKVQAPILSACLPPTITSTVVLAKRKAEETLSSNSGPGLGVQVEEMNSIQVAGTGTTGPPGTLESYFRQSNNVRPPKSRRRVDDSLTKSPLATSTNADTVLLVPSPADETGRVQRVNQGSADPAMEIASTAPVPPSTATNDLPVRGSDMALGQHAETRSQRLFLLATGISPDSLAIKGHEEFYLFMNMRAEFRWVSYEMTSRKWVEATDEYNRRLVQKCGTLVPKKNPLALLRKLGEMEQRLIERVLKDDFKCGYCFVHCQRSHHSL